MLNLIDILLLGLATWRISHMLVWEDGPWDILRKARTFLGKSKMLDELFSCVWCLSIWVGAFFVLSAIIDKNMTGWLALPFALSAIAIFITEYIDG